MAPMAPVSGIYKTTSKHFLLLIDVTEWGKGSEWKGQTVVVRCQDQWIFKTPALVGCSCFSLVSNLDCIHTNATLESVQLWFWWFWCRMSGCGCWLLTLKFTVILFFWFTVYHRYVSKVVQRQRIDGVRGAITAKAYCCMLLAKADPCDLIQQRSYWSSNSSKSSDWIVSVHHGLLCTELRPCRPLCVSMMTSEHRQGSWTWHQNWNTKQQKSSSCRTTGLTWASLYQISIKHLVRCTGTRQQRLIYGGPTSQFPSFEVSFMYCTFSPLFLTCAVNL